MEKKRASLEEQTCRIPSELDLRMLVAAATSCRSQHVMQSGRPAEALFSSRLTSAPSSLCEGTFSLILSHPGLLSPLDPQHLERRGSEFAVVYLLLSPHNSADVARWKREPDISGCERMRFLRSALILAPLHDDALIKLLITDSLGFSNN